MQKHLPPSSELKELVTSIRRFLLGIGSFSMVINLLQLAAPIYMLQIYDRVLASRNDMTLAMLTGLLIAVFALVSALEFIRSRVLVRLGALMEAKINDRVFDAAFAASLDGKGNARQAVSDLTQIRTFITGNGTFAFFDAPWFPIYLAAMFMLHSWIGWFGAISALVLVALTWVTELATQDPLANANRLAIESGNLAQNSLNNAEVIAAMGMLPNIRGRWQSKQSEYLLLQAVASDRAGLIAACTKFFRVTFQSLILGLGAYLAIRQELTGGAMIVGSTLMGRALAPIDQVISNWRGFVQTRLAYSRLNNLLAAYPPAGKAMPLPPPSGQLSVEGVIVAPPGSELPVLNGLTFSIPAGTTVAIIGPSGSGKSSLARTLVGIWTPRTGTVRYDGADLSTWNTTALGPFIGYLPQDIELFDGSVSENIARFGRVDPDKVIDAAIKAGLHESILRMPQGYETPVGPGGAALSGGQRQRIGLARALYGQVRLVVLDEPNSNLDDIGEAALVQAIQKLKTEGCTVVLITHRSSVLSTVDRVMVLREGVIQAYGPRDDVIAAIAQASQAARKNSSPPQGVLLGGSTSQKN